MASRDADDSFPVTTDQKGDPLLHRPNPQLVDRKLMMHSVERGGAGVEQRPQGNHRFLEPGHTGTRLTQLHADRIVLRLRVSGSEPEDEPPTGEPVNSRCSPSEQRRMMELIVEHQRTDAQPSGGPCRHHQRDERVDRADMVKGEQFVVPEGLDLPGVKNERVVIIKAAGLHSESKGLHHPFTIRWTRPADGGTLTVCQASSSGRSRSG